MHIPFLDLKKIQSRFLPQDMESIKELHESGRYIGGQFVDTFEKEFASYCNVQYCVSTGNGLDALSIILRAETALNRLPKNAKIAVPANTYIATILSVVHSHHTPVLFETEQCVVQVDDLKKIKEDYDALLVVDLYGIMVDDDVYAFAKANHKKIYTDTAQSHGGRTSSGKTSGSLAAASAFSFYPTKNLGALGDAGAIVTNDQELAAMCRKIANYGRDSQFLNSEVGVNSRMDPLQALFLSTRLQVLESDNNSRRSIAYKYSQGIDNKKVQLLSTQLANRSVFHIYPIFVEDRVAFIDFMKHHGIQTGCHYEVPPHQQKAFSKWNDLQFPATESRHQQQVSLPCHPLLDTQEVHHIIQTINSY